MDIFMLCSQIKTLVKDHKDQKTDLERYLRSILTLMDKHKADEFTFEVFYKILQDAFTANPVAYQEAWETILLNKTEGHIETYEQSQQIIQRFVADLHKMRNQGKLDKPLAILNLGTEAPSGETIYNFDVYSFLATIARTDGDIKQNEINWGMLGEAVWVGLCYE